MKHVYLVRLSTRIPKKEEASGWRFSPETWDAYLPGGSCWIRAGHEFRPDIWATEYWILATVELPELELIDHLRKVSTREIEVFYA